MLWIHTKKYFPSIWVNVNLLRYFGCELPIEVWYLGDVEFDPYMRRLLEPLGVTCIDARKYEAENPARILCGWELKIYATLYSDFEQVLFLDADSCVLRDPAYLFDSPGHQVEWDPRKFISWVNKFLFRGKSTAIPLIRLSSCYRSETTR